jgi:hypothetical protein
MRRTELTPEQDRQRAAVVRAFSEAGWEDGGIKYTEWFDRGRWVPFEAAFERTTPTGTVLTLHYSAGDATLYLSVEDPDGPEADVNIELDDRHPELLARLAQTADELTAAGAREWAAPLHDQARRILIEDAQ